jgi:hypothetical protein
MLFIYSNWIYTRWHWSVDLYKNRKETAQNEKQYTKNIKNTKTQNIQNRKQKYETKNIPRTYKEYNKTSAE